MKSGGPSAVTVSPSEARRCSASGAAGRPRSGDASKIALVSLVRLLRHRGYALIDCQMHTQHLASLGARDIPRERFSRLLSELIHYSPRPEGPWTSSRFVDEPLTRTA